MYLIQYIYSFSVIKEVKIKRIFTVFVEEATKHTPLCLWNSKGARREFRFIG